MTFELTMSKRVVEMPANKALYPCLGPDCIARLLYAVANKPGR